MVWGKRKEGGLLTYQKEEAGQEREKAHDGIFRRGKDGGPCAYSGEDVNWGCCGFVHPYIHTNECCARRKQQRKEAASDMREKKKRERRSYPHTHTILDLTRPTTTTATPTLKTTTTRTLTVPSPPHAGRQATGIRDAAKPAFPFSQKLVLVSYVVRTYHHHTHNTHGHPSNGTDGTRR